MAKCHQKWMELIANRRDNDFDLSTPSTENVPEINRSPCYNTFNEYDMNGRHGKGREVKENRMRLNEND